MTMNIKILNYREFNSGSLKGFLSFEFVEIGLEIHNCKHFMKDEHNEWFAMPAEKYEKDNEIKYKDTVRWTERDQYFRWQEAMKKALAEYFNNCLADAETKSNGGNKEIYDDIPF